jgi:hypothetical protein
MAASVEYDGKATGIDRPTGVQQAVLSNVVDLGDRPDKFHPGKTKHQAILIFQLAEKLEIEGKQVPFQQTEFVSLTLNEKSKLRRYVEGMLGKTVEQLLEMAKAKGNKSFKLDIEKLIGRNCMLTLSKKEAKAGEDAYTTIEAIAPLMKGLTALTVANIPVPEWVTEFVKQANAEAGSPATQDAAATDVDLDSVLDA